MKNYKSSLPCLVCLEAGENRVCLHHIKTRKSGGGDEAFNLMPLCLRHHNEVHALGLPRFSEKHPAVKTWLTDFDWDRCPITNKWVHP
jgi:hypothetical protein